MNDRLFIIVSVLTLKNLKSRTSAFGAYVHSNAVLPSILTPDDAFIFSSRFKSYLVEVELCPVCCGIV
jgi:hypothetical protein